MKKWLISIMLVISIGILFGKTDIASAEVIIDSGSCGDSLEWTLNDKGMLRISGDGPMNDFTSVRKAPWSSFSTSIKEIIIEEDVTTIGKYAFYEMNGMSATLSFPSSLTSIGICAFYNCSGLHGNLFLSDEIISIGWGAFRGCSGLTGELRIPSSITRIEDSTFYDCSGFSCVLDLPVGLSFIGSYAFRGCSGLYGELRFPISVMSIEDRAFYNCSGFSGQLVLPEKLTYIGSYAFSNCSGFTGDLVLPEGLIEIGDYAFQMCSGFSGELVFPDTITTIGSGAFYNCKQFSGSLSIPDNVTIIGQNTFMGCSGFSGDLELPEHLTGIRSYAFYGCTNLAGSITLPSSLTTIGEYAFAATKINEIVFLGNAPSSCQDAFLNMPSALIIMFDESKEGWSSPKWEGVTAFPIHDHNDRVEEIVKATLTSDGTVVHRCSVCNKEVSRDIILKVSITLLGDFVTEFKAGFYYDGSQKEPQVIVKDSSGKDIDPRYYSVQFSNNIEPGTAIARLRFNTYYSINQSFSFIIRKARIEDVLFATDLVYDGTVRDIPFESALGLIENKDFVVTDSCRVTDGHIYYTPRNSIKNAGRYLIFVEAKGSHVSGTAGIYYSITPAGISDKTVTFPGKRSYTGKTITPTVKIDGLEIEKDFTVSYSNNIEIGTAYITINGIGNYTGIIKKTFEIVERDPTVRIYGSTRYDTSIRIADELKKKFQKDNFDAVILADGRNYPDALAGSYLSNQFEAPILLVNNSHIPAVQNYIKENLNAEDGAIYILGGTGAVPDAVMEGMDGYAFERLAGASRYETNIEILKAGPDNNEIVVCTGKDYADSLSASAVGRPILLVKNTLQDNQKTYLESLGTGKTFYIIGGEGAVTKDVENALKAYGTVKRVFGSSRYDTSVEVAKEFFPDADAAVLAYGQNFPDGLCGGALACYINGASGQGVPLILTRDSKAQIAAAFTSEKEIKSGAVLGGTALISDESVGIIFDMDPADIIVITDTE